MFAGGMYGGLHALAWNAPFRTSGKRLLWQTSCVAVMCHGLVFIISGYLYNFLVRGIIRDDISLFIYCMLNPTFWLMLEDRTGKQKVIFVTFYIFFCSMTLFYLLARLYLVVESFISLFDSPIGVYSTPVWSEYFPHLG